MKHRSLGGFAVCLVLSALACSHSEHTSTFGTPEFEGTIEFDQVFEPIEGGPPVDWLKEGLGEGKTFRYLQGNYRFDYRNAATEWTIYRAEENAEYTFVTGDNKLLHWDCSKEMVPVEGMTMDGPDGQILGRDVQRITISYANGASATVWFDPTLRIETGRFQEYRAVPFWGVAEGMWLRWRYEGTNATSITTAVSITRGELSPEIFEIPTLPLEDLPAIK